MPSSFKWSVAGKYEDIKYHKMDGIAKITINRPHVRNAFRPPLFLKPEVKAFSGFFLVRALVSLNV